MVDTGLMYTMYKAIHTHILFSYSIYLYESMIHFTDVYSKFYDVNW